MGRETFERHGFWELGILLDSSYLHHQPFHVTNGTFGGSGIESFIELLAIDTPSF
jgi:hypothetical protein